MSDEETSAPSEELPLESVADTLRRTREKKGITLEDVAGQTRIPTRFIEAIERGDFGELPASNYAVGFSRTYAKLLGLDQDEIVQRVRDELGDTGHRGAAPEDELIHDPSKLPSSGLAWAGVIAAVILVAGMMVFYNSYYATGADPMEARVAAKEGSYESDVGNDAGNEGASEAGSSQALADQTPINPSGQVVFTALEDGIWARFTDTGGERLFEGQMGAGEFFALPTDAASPRINTGRPDAFAITIGGRSVPKLAETPETMGNALVSASALLDRGEGTPAGVPASDVNPS